jgi:hypothetical protein
VMKKVWELPLGTAMLGVGSSCQHSKTPALQFLVRVAHPPVGEVETF